MSPSPISLIEEEDQRKELRVPQKQSMVEVASIFASDVSSNLSKVDQGAYNDYQSPLQ